MSVALDGIAEFLPEFTGEVHWLAAAYPLNTEDVEVLAADIAANGLRDPITLDRNGVLIDGRNRLEACELAGVEPRFTVTHDDPVAVVTSKNAARRHLSAGQRAMGVAVGMFEAGQWLHDKGSWKRGSIKNAKGANAHLASDDLKRCGQILAHDRALALAVLSGDRNLREAYDQVQDAKRLERAQQTKRDELTQHAPDLLGKVSADFTLDMAYAAYRERDADRLKAEQAAEDNRRKVNGDFSAAIEAIRHVVWSDERLAEFVAGWEPSLTNWTADDLRETAQQLERIADCWEGPR